MRGGKSNRRLILGLIEVHILRTATDKELLRRFVAWNDESAFRVIAERHGPMVLSVCRRALKCPHDAEDAFQATFLVLSNRAASIRDSASLGGWLHGVAARIALKIRRGRARQFRREQAVARPATGTAEHLTWAEFKSALDEELLRLPEQLRTVLVHCYLEGRTRDEAADHLGLTRSAVHGRLERARRLLAERLRKRGLALSTAVLPVALCPPELLATVRASALVRDSGSVAPRVQSLANEVLKGTIMTKTKWATAALICMTTLAVGVGYTTAQPRTGDGKDTVNPHVPVVTKSGRPKGSDDSDNLKNTLLALDKHMWEAGAMGDWKERQKFFADDMVSISVVGKYGKADAALADQRTRTTDWTVRDAEIVRVSPDVAMLSYVYDCKVLSPDGKVLETRKDYRVVYTWAYRNGGWVIVFGHDDHGRLAKGTGPVGANTVIDLPSVGIQSQKQPSADIQEKGNKYGSGGTVAADLDLLKTKVQLATLDVREKQLKLDAAVEKKSNRNEIELLKIDLERARLLVQEAELNLAAAQKRAQAPTAANESRPSKQ
jgi:RNA polymerase sigma factor (sigma-70 family)